MKVASNGESNQIKVQVKSIKSDIAECKHLMSGFKVNVYIRKGTKLEVGQVILVEYKRGTTGGGYVLVDDLIQEIDVKVLEAQHIINSGMMYTSLIMENPTNHERMHSLVPSSNSLFGSTSVIITGDIVKVRLNNGNIFSIGNVIH